MIPSGMSIPLSTVIRQVTFMITSTLPPLPETLTAADCAQLEEEGFLAFSGALTPHELEATRVALREMIERGLSDSRNSQWKSTKGDQPVWTLQRSDSPLMIQFEQGRDPRDGQVDEVEGWVRKFMWFSQEASCFQQMLAPDHRLYRCVASVLGDKPVCFQEMALVKPAFVGREKPWHQDNAYFSVTPLDSILGLWIALDDATAENGCMHVIPGGHKAGGRQHHHTYDCEIMPGRLDTSQAVPVPVPAGGVMLFYGMLPHQTPPNRSPHRRRALQLHFHSATSQKVSAEEYDKIFAEPDGTPASCRAAAQG